MDNEALEQIAREIKEGMNGKKRVDMIWTLDKSLISIRVELADRLTGILRDSFPDSLVLAEPYGPSDIKVTKCPVA